MTTENKQSTSQPTETTDELTQLVREGVQTETRQDRFKLGMEQMLGNAPMGVDAKNKTVRKLLGGGSELLYLLKHGTIGLFASVIGLAFLYFGLFPAFEYKTVLVGVVALALGIYELRSAYHAARNLESIAKA